MRNKQHITESVTSHCAEYLLAHMCLLVFLSILFSPVPLQDINKCKTVVGEEVSTPLTNALILPPYASLCLSISLSVNLNLFLNMVFTPKDTNSMKVGQGRGCFTALVFFGLSV